MNLKKKTGVLLLIFLIGAIVLGTGVNFLCENIATNEQKQNSHSKLELIDSMIQASKTSEEEITATFDEQYESKADSVAFMAQNMTGFEYTNEYMEELRGILNVDYLSIKNADGVVVTESGSKPDAGEDNEDAHTYEADINNGYTVEIVNNTQELKNNLEENASLSYVLDDVHVGQDGFAFAVHAQKKTIIFHPDSELIGEKAEDHGIDVSKMVDGTDVDLSIDGVKYFCSVKQIDNGLIAVAVPYSEITANRISTIAIALIIYIILAGIIILYCCFLSHDHKSKIVKGYNRELGRRILCIAVCGAVISFAVTYYTQTLLTLSQQSITNNRRGTEMKETLAQNSETLKTETTQYENRYLEKVELGAYIIQNTSDDALTRDYMISLRDALKVTNLSLFNTDGSIKTSDSNLWSFKISEDKDDQTYEFWTILNGTQDEVVQDLKTDDEGNLKQYIGKAIVDENHKTVGMLEIGVTADAIEKATLNTDLATVLKGIQIGKGGFAFAVNIDDNTFAYFPDSTLIGQPITSYGMTEEMVKADYNDFITINGEKYYCASGKFENYMTYVAVPFTSMNTTALPVSLVSTAVMFVFMMILWAIISFSTKAYDASIDEKNIKNSNDMIDVDMGDGHTAKTRSVTSRWNHKGVSWPNMTAGQKTTFILNNVLVVLAFVILIAIICADAIFAEDSLIHFILKGKWQQGVNIFSLTYCVLILIATIEITIILRRFIIWLSHSMNAKGETICRMIDNCLKTFSVIFILYYCLGTLGVDTKTLLASAGILTLVVGLGAQGLVSDVLAGLFIIFESEFQVGDIVTIDGFRGTVVEIGVRTTKVKEGSGNVKIFSNSSVKNILNMTKDFSVVSFDMTVMYKEDLHYIEKTFKEEFPRIRKKLPAIVEGPFYRGVSSQGLDSMTLTVTAKCLESDRAQLEKDLRRQLKLVFDRHDINIPSSEIGSIRPAEQGHETLSQKEVNQAEDFVKAQNKEFKDTGIKED